MIYTLIARQKQVLVEYSPHQGNFSQLAKQKALPNVNYDKMYSLFATSDYEFYFYIVDKFVFMAMVKKGYEMKTTIMILKLIKEKFYLTYGQDIRKTADPDCFQGLVPFLKLVMEEANK